MESGKGGQKVDISTLPSVFEGDYYKPTKNKTEYNGESQNEKSSSWLPVARPCTLLLSYLLFLIFFFLYFFYGSESVTTAHQGDTVFLHNFNDRLGSRLQISETPFNGDVTARNCSIYVVPTSQVVAHSEQKSFQESEKFEANVSWSGGQIIYIYQLLSLEYDVTVSSENETTSDGELVVFSNFGDFNLYLTGYDYIKKNAVFNQTFPIGANNQSKTTTIKFTTQQQHKYYYITCYTPGKVTFSYKATVVHHYYDFKDYGKEQCNVHFGLPYDKECSMDVAANDDVTLMVYIHPNITSPPRTQITVDATRLLPPPNVLVFMFFLLVFLPLFGIGVYTFKNI